MSVFSPGPWRRHPTLWNVIVDANGAVIAEIIGDHDCARTDAAVMAAAWDMFAQLQWYEDHLPSNNIRAQSWHLLRARIETESRAVVQTCWQAKPGTSLFCGLGAGHRGLHAWECGELEAEGR